MADESCGVGGQTSSIDQGLDQSYKPYIGIKLIQAYPCSKSTPDGDVPGYNVKYPDGYESWSPKEAFEVAYLQLLDETKISPVEIEAMVAEVTASRIDPKTCLVKSEQVTGFTQYATAACVSPENYNEEIGKKIAMAEIKDRLWFAMGFVLQWGRYGLKKVTKV